MVRLLQHAAHRVGQVGELLQPGRHPLDPLRREQQPVKQALAGSRRAGGIHVEGVGLEDPRGARAQGGRHGADGAGALLVARERQAARGLLGGARQPLDVCLDVLDLGHGCLPADRRR